MDTIVVAALVAGIVSIIGFIVNLIVAREARRSMLAEIATQSRIKEGEASLSDLKAFLATSESLRFACVRLLKILTEQSPNGLDSIRLELFRDAAKDYASVQKELFTGWFRVILEIRNPKTYLVAALMHDSNNLCAATGAMIEFCLREIDRGKESEAFEPRDRELLAKQLGRLIEFLEQLNAHLIAERDALMTEIWGTETKAKAISTRDTHRP